MHIGHTAHNRLIISHFYSIIIEKRINKDTNKDIIKNTNKSILHRKDTTMNQANERYHAQLSEAAKEARRAYAREWRRRNPDKIRAARDRYWEKKAREAKA